MMKKRKTRRQVLAEKTATAQRLVDQANSVINPLEFLQSFHTYVTKDNQTITLSCVRARDAERCISLVFNLMERNMKTLYEQSEWGWDPVAKKKELTEPAAWYLVASSASDDKFLGFSHFRFDVDNREEVLYCYEMQLEPTVRRKGLGQFMMSALERMASKSKMRKVVLTVLKNNPSAMQFFYSLGYKKDKTSPSASDQSDYIILSKAVDSETES